LRIEPVVSQHDLRNFFGPSCKYDHCVDTCRKLSHVSQHLADTAYHVADLLASMRLLSEDDYCFPVPDPVHPWEDRLLGFEFIGAG